MRILDNMPFIRSAFSTLYDQMCEIMVALVFVISSVLVIWDIVTSSHGIAISVFAAIAAIMMVAPPATGFSIFVVRLASSVPMLRKLFGKIDFNDPSISERGISQKTLVNKMFGLAMLRYIKTTLQAYLVA